MKRNRWLGTLTLSLVVLMASQLPATAGQPQSWPQRLGLPGPVVAEYLSRFPDVPMPTLMARLALIPARKQLLEQIAIDSEQTFAGSWYDYQTGVWQLRATNISAADSLAARARARGIIAQTQVVPFSLATLHARAAAISAGHDARFAGPLATRKVGIDVERNRVIAALPARTRTLSTVADPMVDTIDDLEAPMQFAACNNRRNCGSPLRGGLVIWRGSYSNPQCSLGFTAHASDGSRWALTAGHCVNAINETWGHGEQVLGPVRQCSWPGGSGCVQSSPSNVDAARIKIDNSYWLANSSWGYLFNSPTSKVDVDYAIGSLGTIEKGDAICYSGWHRNYTGFTSGNDAVVSSTGCGTIGNVSDPNLQGMPRVDSIDVCRGDSGGAVIFYPGGGLRYAYGLVTGFPKPPGTNPYCSPTNQMVFSPMPAINKFFDDHSTATVRVDIR